MRVGVVLGMGFLACPHASKSDSEECLLCLWPVRSQDLFLPRTRGGSLQGLESGLWRLTAALPQNRRFDPTHRSFGAWVAGGQARGASVQGGRARERRHPPLALVRCLRRWRRHGRHGHGPWARPRALARPLAWRRRVLQRRLRGVRSCLGLVVFRGAPGNSETSSAPEGTHYQYDGFRRRRPKRQSQGETEVWDDEVSGRFRQWLRFGSPTSGLLSTDRGRHVASTSVGNLRLA